jgi:hypothetical protein
MWGLDSVGRGSGPTACFCDRSSEPLLTYGVEPSLRSCQMCSPSRTSHHFMKPEGSLPCSQELSTGPYPKPNRSSPYHLSYPISLRKSSARREHELQFSQRTDINSLIEEHEDPTSPLYSVLWRIRWPLVPTIHILMIPSYLFLFHAHKFWASIL